MGTAWVDAEPYYWQEVEARIGDVVCGQATPFRVVDSDSPSFFLYVMPATEKPGCGTPGAVISFFVDGRQAHQTAEWERDSSDSLSLVVGAPIAWIYGKFTLTVSPVSYEVIPFVNGVACGYQLNPWQGVGEFGYGVVVYPKELKEGCGVEGSVVTLSLVNTSTGKAVAAVQTGIWHADTVQTLNLVFPDLGVDTLPVSGDGGSSGFPWAYALIAPALVACGGAAFVWARRAR